MRHADGQPGAVGEALQLAFPEAGAHAVAAAGCGIAVTFFGISSLWLFNLSPDYS
jgi:hypothetical protein